MTVDYFKIKAGGINIVSFVYFYNWRGIEW